MGRGVPSFSGAVARRRRLARGWTADQMGLQLHVTEQTVLRWERGRSFPTAAHLGALADLLCANVADLIATQPTRQSTLRDLRHLQGLSIQAAAERAKLSASNVVRLERGLASLRGLGSSLAAAYNVSIDELQRAYMATQQDRLGQQSKR